MSATLNLVDLLKTYTTIDHSFLDTFFNKFNLGDELHFDISENSICEYLGITLNNLRKRLNNSYKTTEYHYFENIDYIKKRVDKSSTKLTYFLNYKTFEKFALDSRGEKSEKVKNF